MHAQGTVTHAASRLPESAVSRPIAATVDVSMPLDALIHPLTADGCRRVPIVVQGSTGLKIGLAAPTRKRPLSTGHKKARLLCVE